LDFPVLARWETAKPIRLASAVTLPELAGQFYVIRVHGLPILPAKNKQPSEALLAAIKEGTSLERKDKSPIACDHLFTGSGDGANDVLLFFPRTPNPIKLTDKFVTLESRFSAFHLSIRFALKDMLYKGSLSL